jgi:hypothetical protein
VLHRNQALVLQIAPKDDETKALQAYGGPVNELSAPEKFLLAMSTVPRLTDKLNILILILQFKVNLSPSQPASIPYYIVCFPSQIHILPPKASATGTPQQRRSCDGDFGLLCPR